VSRHIERESLVYERVKERGGERERGRRAAESMVSQLWKFRGLGSWCLPSAGRRGDRSARG
jgi:hypothetical protein